MIILVFEFKNSSFRLKWVLKNTKNRTPGTRQCGYPHQGKKRGEEKRRKEERKRRRKRISRAHSAIITCL